jgi:hypothetical protein
MRESRKRYAPTDGDRLLVKLAKACSYTDEQIRFIVNAPYGLALNTMKKHFADELEHGADAINLRVAGNLLKIATQGQDKCAVTAGIFWMKSRMSAFAQQSPGMSATFEMNKGKAGEGSADGADADLPSDAPIRFTLTMGEAPGKPKDGVDNP